MSNVTQQQQRKTCIFDISLSGAEEEVEIVSTDCSYLQMLNLGTWLDSGEVYWMSLLLSSAAHQCRSRAWCWQDSAHSCSYY